MRLPHLLFAAALLARGAAARPCSSSEFCAGRATADGATCSDGMCTACGANAAPAADFSACVCARGAFYDASSSGSSASANPTCVACSQAGPGQRVAAACTPTADATLAACAPGSYSAGSQTDACTPCPPGPDAALTSVASCARCAAGYAQSTSGGALSCTTASGAESIIPLAAVLALVAIGVAYCFSRRRASGVSSTTIAVSWLPRRRRLRKIALAAVLCAVSFLSVSEWRAPLQPALRLQRGIVPFPGRWPAPYARAPLAGCPAAYLAHLDEYVGWHAATLASLKRKAAGAPRGSLSLPVPVVVYRCALTDDCGGVGDRVSGLTAMFYHYGLRLRALFLIDMPAWAGSVQPATFDWDFPSLAFGANGLGGWLAAYAGVTVLPPQTAYMLHGECVNLTVGFPCMHTLDSAYYNETRAAPPEMPLAPGIYAAVTNRGVWSNFNGHRSVWIDALAAWAKHRFHVSRLGLSAADWGCLYRSLIWPTLSLAREIAEDIAPLAARPVALW